MAEGGRERGREARGGDARPNRGGREKGGGLEVKEETEVNNRNGKLFPPPPKLSLFPLPTSASDSLPPPLRTIMAKGEQQAERRRRKGVEGVFAC